MITLVLREHIWQGFLILKGGYENIRKQNSQLKAQIYMGNW